MSISSEFALSELLYEVKNKDMYDCVDVLCTSIIDSNIILGKEQEHNPEIKYGIKNYITLQYAKSCTFLVNEINNLTSDLSTFNTHTNKTFKYFKNTDTVELFALTTNIELNTKILIGDEHIQRHSLNYYDKLPFFLVKEFVERKGYELNCQSSKTHPETIKNLMEITVFCVYPEKEMPEETFCLSLSIKNQTSQSAHNS